MANEKIKVLIDTDLAEDIVYTRATKLIKDYEIQFRCGDKVQSVEVTDNINRMNTFVVNGEIDAVRIIPKSNYGSKYYEIFGVKIY